MKQYESKIKDLAKLPKKTKLERTKKRIIDMNRIANLFDITIDKPYLS